MNQIRGGLTNYERQDQPVVRWQGKNFSYRPVLRGGSVIINLRGYTIGASPLNILQDRTPSRRFAQHVAVDGEFATASFLHTADNVGLTVIARLKSNLPELLHAAEARFRNQPPSWIFRDGSD